MLYLIGIGLGDEKDITIKGLEAVKNCSKVFLENYTSRLVDFDIAKLEKIYGKKITLADRELVEKNCEKEILEPAKANDVALLIIGSPLGATTHVDILQRAKKMGIEVQVIDNAGILGAVGITGLSLYKFGRVTTIPRNSKDVTSPYDVMVENKKIGLHTLLLLDVNSNQDKLEMMSAREGLDYLIRCGMEENEMVVACGGLGGAEHEIIFGKAIEIKANKYPQCIIVPGDLHFVEEEALKNQ
tara:strand:- start:5033 stop:5761 length:729 start_codon:yes stop_codon:yes gene_type:complete